MNNASGIVGRHLRDHLLPEVTSGTSFKPYIGGFTMSIVELSDETLTKTPYVIVTVLVLSYILLMLAFRSWLIPLKAIVRGVAHTSGPITQAGLIMIGF